MHGDKDILYGFSAFRLHRIPYQVLMLCPPMPSLWDNVRSPLIPSHPVIKEIIGSPIHVLVTDRKDRRTAKAVRTHLVESQLPPGAIEDSELNIKTCSPLFTLLTLARHLDTVELAMAMYEFCGKFSVFKPTPEIEKLLCSQEARALNDGPKAWKRVKSTARATSGKASALWVRPPLINLDELQNYASQCPHIHGRKRFEQAARLVTGVTASPFEVQLSLLLALPKEMGGKGMPFFSNNGKIPLPREARSICKCNNVYADLLF